MSMHLESWWRFKRIARILSPSLTTSKAARNTENWGERWKSVQYRFGFYMHFVDKEKVGTFKWSGRTRRWQFAEERRRSIMICIGASTLASLWHTRKRIEHKSYTSSGYHVGYYERGRFCLWKTDRHRCEYNTFEDFYDYRQPKVNRAKKLLLFLRSSKSIEIQT